jgi:hypothetical protein
MSVDQIIQTALDAPGLPTYPNLYTGADTDYLVWSYVQIPAVAADDAPHAARYLITVRYYLPHKKDPNPIKLYLSWALFHAGCTWPTITPNGDSEGQGYAFECEYTDGGGYYGADPT